MSHQAGEAKLVPLEAEVRGRIREEAGRAAAKVSRQRPLTRAELEELGGDVLRRLKADTRYLGFAMVAVSNEFWRMQFASVPHERRLLLLPQCLHKAAHCRGTYDAVGLHCAGCGACSIFDLKTEAESLGYQVLVAEGTPAVVEHLLDGRADAIMGVACLDSLEKAFERVLAAGFPHAAVPLLTDGCSETTAELDVVRTWMHQRVESADVKTRTYAPLLRAATSLFAERELRVLLDPCLRWAGAEQRLGEPRPSQVTDAIALDWLGQGGKRFRPFVTLASYAAMTLGSKALDPDADLSEAFPLAAKRVALAIEVLHKASLVHDDIEDDDAYRYGRETLHRRHGLPLAVNAGDHLIGVGYHLIALGTDQLGADCVADILSQLSQAHLKLCRGQGAELILRKQGRSDLTARDVQAVYALKTAPAFEAAMYAGLRMAEGQAGPAPTGRATGTSRRVTAGDVRSFCRYLGVAYQVANDLDDWQEDGHNKLVSGQDSLARRPTMLRAFAWQAADEAGRVELSNVASSDLDDAEKLKHRRRLYEELGVFTLAELLVEKYRVRARAEAERMEAPALRDLLHFVVEIVL